MDEREFRRTLSEDDLEKRAYIIPLTVYDFATLEPLNRYSEELEVTWDALINAAIEKLAVDIESICKLRL